MTGTVTTFDKYSVMGAYHWAECNRASPHYNPPLEARYHAVLKRVRPATHVLDLGCGDGFLMGLLSAKARRVVGIDAEPSGLALAEQKLRGLVNCGMTAASCYALPFASETFDVVILADVIEHLHDPDACLQEVRRVLGEDGQLLLTTPQWRPDRVWDRHHVKEYRPEELLACLTGHFAQVTFTFFCRADWYRLYATRVGCRMVRWFSRHFYNPYAAEGVVPTGYHQIMAVCDGPRP